MCLKYRSGRQGGDDAFTLVKPTAFGIQTYQMQSDCKSISFALESYFLKILPSRRKKVWQIMMTKGRL